MDLKRKILVLLTGIVSTFPVASEVIGHLGWIVEVNGIYEARGWSCEPGNDSPTLVEVKAGGNVIASGLANRSNEAAVSSLCNTTGVGHRFRIAIPGSKIRANQGKELSAEGVALSDNNLRGGLVSPTPAVTIPSTLIKGYVDRLFQEDGEYFIRGWACEKGRNESIPVHVYAKHSAYEGGVYVFQGIANQEKDTSSAINNLCSTANTPHRFVLRIPNSVLEAHKGDDLFVHGIQSVGGGVLNMPLTKTKIYSVPPQIGEVNGFNLDALHYESDGTFEVVSGGDIAVSTNSTAWSTSNLIGAGVHSAVIVDGSQVGGGEEGIVYAVGTHSAQIIKLDVANESGVITFEPAYIEGCEIELNQESQILCLTNPHDIVFHEGSYYVIDSEWGKSKNILIKFASFEALKDGNFEQLNLGEILEWAGYDQSRSYFRSLSSINNQLHINLSSYGDVFVLESLERLCPQVRIEMGDMNNEDSLVIDENCPTVRIERGYRNAADLSIAGSIAVPAGVYDKVGFVLNDVEYYKGYYYATNYFDRAYEGVGSPIEIFPDAGEYYPCPASNAQYLPEVVVEECANKNRLVRWKTWEDFSNGNVEDLDYLFNSTVVPYYLTVSNNTLYMAAFSDKAVLNENKKKVIYTITTNEE